VLGNYAPWNSPRDEEEAALDKRGVRAPACGHLELPEYIEVGLCGRCADEAVDRAQQRQIELWEGH
jgi:hypothetical protein